MSFGTPPVLLALLAIPLLVWLYGRIRARRRELARAFVSAPLEPSVAPQRPGWRVHAPFALLALATAVLIGAAAKPRRAISVPVRDAAVMLINDVSASMAATDVRPSRLGAAVAAERRFLGAVPNAVRVGLLEFNATPVLLQAPIRARAPVRAALETLRPGGHTDIGNAIQAAVTQLRGLRGPGGRRVPAAAVLLSDGGSTGGLDPLAAARAAGALRIPIYTVALGTAEGVIDVGHGRRAHTVPVPLEPAELRAIARASGGRSYTVADAGTLRAVYAHLAQKLGRRTVHRPLTATFAGAGLALLVASGGLSLIWFGRLA
jgi:Ca-activated chloride channel family protein